jgi:pyruvate,water dikinase
MIALLQSYLGNDGLGPEALARAQAEAREAATHTLLRGEPYLRRVGLRIVLRATQGAIRMRERARMKQALLYTRLRHVVLRIGDALVANGALDTREDVFFLGVDEIRGGVARGIVASRKAEFAAFAHVQPPDSFSLEPGAAWKSVGHVPSQAVDEKAILRGTSACGGETRGIAHVIEDVAGIGAFRAGEILVTRQTDPGWAAVFFMVKGLVIERGGMLSHGAIIAREYGIPAVVGVPGATRRIASGEQVRVDGDQGVVELAGR